jgi:hypothetical protein
VQKNEGTSKKENFEGEEFRAPMEERQVIVGCQPTAAHNLTKCGLCPPFSKFLPFLIFILVL